jgi:hypothetical protein
MKLYQGASRIEEKFPQLGIKNAQINEMCANHKLVT